MRRLDARIRSFAGDFDFCLVDTPGHDWTTLSHAAVAVDLTLVVTRPTEFDAATALQVQDALKRFNLPYAFLISQASPRQSRKSEAWAEVYATRGELIDTRVTSLAAYQDAITWGLGVHEYDPSGRAAAEIEAVLDRILQRVRRDKNVQTRRCQIGGGSYPG